jgi:serine/threonine protein kinase
MSVVKGDTQLTLPTTWAGSICLHLQCAKGHHWKLSGEEMIPGRLIGTTCPTCFEPATALKLADAPVAATSSGVRSPAAQAAKGGLEDVTLHDSVAEIATNDDSETVRGFAIIDTVGRGSTGVVYKAEQLGQKRVVALKVLLAGAHASAREMERFRREAELLTRLQHPNIVQIFSVGEHRKRPYLVMEYLSGGTLLARMTKKPPTVKQAVSDVLTLATAVGAAHRVGVVHRDLKPANVLLAQDGTLKITDFGLAKEVEETSEFTATGAIIGTPAYMAPEQAEGRMRQVGTATDVYALGAILYEMLTGRPPLKGPTVLDTLELIRNVTPQPPSKLVPGLDRDLDLICLKCLTKDPRHRYAHAGELADELGRFLRGIPVEVRQNSPLIQKIAEAVADDDLAGNQDKQMGMVRGSDRRNMIAGFVTLAVLGIALLGGAAYFVWALFFQGKP